jgi:hypothetical protein
VIDDSIVYSQSHSTGFVEECYGICGIAKMARSGGIIFFCAIGPRLALETDRIVEGAVMLLLIDHPAGHYGFGL